MSVVDAKTKLRGLSAETKERLRRKISDQGVVSRITRQPREGGGGQFALSAAQERLWVHHQLDPDSPAFNVGFVVRFDGALDPQRLHRSLQQLSVRHESLRTEFVDLVGVPHQRVLPRVEWEMPLVDLSLHSTDERAKALDAIEAALGNASFDLGRAPLVRTTLVRLNDHSHDFFFAMHHIATDGWSMGHLLRDLAAIYAADTQPSGLAPLDLQYADYSVWDREQDSTDDLDYWKERLLGAPQRSTFPPDLSRPPSLSQRGETLTFEVERTLRDAAERLAGESGITPFNVYAATLTLLLAEYSGQREVVIGTPTANRPRAEVESIVGFFVNMVSLRVDVPVHTGTFRSLLAATNAEANRALNHQRTSFARVVEAVSPERDASASPIFQVVLSVRNFPWEDTQFSGVRASVRELRRRGAQYDLQFTITRVENGLRLEVEYAEDLYERATVERLARHFSFLLSQVTAAPERPLREVSCVPPEERAEIVTAWNATNATFGPFEAIHQTVSARAKAAPTSTAVSFEGHSISYRQFDERTNQLARHLRKLGVGPDVVVGVCMERSIELVESLHAIVKAGGAYLPLDPSYPSDRLHYMMDAARMKLALCQPQFAHLIPEGLAVTVEGKGLGLDEPVDALDVSIHPESAAYLIFTSGSTGKPKGVVNRHASIFNRIHWQQHAVPISGTDVVLQKTPFSFDVSVWEFFWPLMFGAKLVVASPDGHRDPAYLRRVIEQEGVTLLHFVPSMLQAFVGELEGGACASLTKVLSSGEALQKSLVEEFLERSRAELHNLYGPTEAAVDVTWWRCRRGDRRASVSLGRPIANTAIYIVDAEFRAVPIGASGEICIGGIGLARGYANRPDLTADRFVPDPFSSVPGMRIYRTGDLGRFAKDGSIEYLGRLDHQVKIRGLRIELGEIESRLSEHPSVDEAVVVVRDVAGAKSLVAFVSGRSLGNEEALARWMSKALPEHMVPVRFITMPKLPLSPNGKVDRNSLPPIDAPLENTTSATSDEEHDLVAIWQELLATKAVGTRDGFFRLGGDSVMVLRMVSRARARGFTFTAKDVFEQKTIEKLAKLPRGALGYDELSVAAAGTSVPLLPMQKWLLEQQLRNPNHFNLGFEVRLCGVTEAHIVERALGLVVARHPGLRCQFEMRLGEWTQTVMAPVPVPLTISTGTTEEVQTAARDLHRNLNISQGILFACHLVTHDDEHATLVVALHHLCSDVVSMRVLYEDFMVAYDAYRARRSPLFAAGTLAQHHWVEGLRRVSEDYLTAVEQEYWRALPWSEARTIAPDTDLPNLEGETRERTLVISSEILQALASSVADSFHTDLHTILLSALASALSDHTHARTIHLDVEGHGREEPSGQLDVSRTIGWFTSTFPFVATVPSGPPVSRLRALKEQWRGVPTKGLLHPRATSYGVAFGNTVSEMPRAEVLYNFLGRVEEAHSADHTWAMTSAPHFRDPANARSHLLEILGSIEGDSLSFRVRYSQACHSEATVDRLIDCLEKSLIEFAALAANESTWTPSDFGLRTIGVEEFDRLIAGAGEIEDGFPLTPSQEGMLFHSLLAPEEGVFVEQFVTEFAGELSSNAFLQAWTALVDRHPILRARLHWEGLEQPFATIPKNVALPFEESDWSERSEEHQRELCAYLEADRVRGFDLRQSPLLRLHVIRLKESHVVVLTFHHILLDGWSVAIVAKEFFDLLRGEKGFSERALPFSGYVRWLRKETREHAAATAAYWKETFAGAPATLLGSALSRPRTARGAVTSHEVRICGPEMEKLRAFARSNDFTLNSVATSAWALTLKLHCQSNDVSFGTVVSGRPEDVAGAEDVVGMCINTVPTRVRVPSDGSASEWMSALQVQQTAQRPFEASGLAEILRTCGRTEFFDTALVFENYPMDVSVVGEGWSLIRSEFMERTNFTLTALVVPEKNDLCLRLLVDPSRFSLELAKPLLDHWRAAFAALTADGGAGQLSSLSLLSADERAMVLEGWNASEMPMLGGLLHERFQVQAKLTPKSVAIRFEGASVSYEEFDRRTNQLANYLRTLGVGPDVVVGVCAERSVELVEALYAVMKAGGAYLPIDPSHPAERIAFTLADAGVTTVLVQTKFAHLVSGDDRRIVALDDVRAWSGTSHAAPNVPLHPESAAYVIYTSGSTGRPKGVVNRHSAILNRIDWQTRAIGLSPSDVVLQKTPFGFDVSVWEFFWPLMIGATLVVAKPDGHRDPAYLMTLIEEEAVTTLHFVPSMLQMFVDELSDARCATLTRVLCSGEALPKALVEAFFRKSRAELHNLYGPTEAAVDVTWWRCERTDDRVFVPLGRPIGNLKIYILDRDLRPVPAGVPGEICLGGVGLAREYLGRPDLTADRFVPDPFARGGARMYRTGDLGRFDQDGIIEYLGRLDHQVKIRGLRIELGEIEARLREHRAVHDCVVVARTLGATSQLALVAYLTCPLGESCSDDELAEWLKRALPEYMVPAAWMRLPSLPLSSNGKVDRAALPVPATDARPQHESASDPIEMALAQLWRDVLRVDLIGRRDNFFALGGNSLLAMRVSSRARAMFACELPIALLFANPTLKQFAEVVRERQAGGFASLLPLQRSRGGGPHPLSFGQESLWLLQELSPLSSAYHIHGSLRLRGPLELARFREALHMVARRHDSLRTTFHAEEGVPTAMVHETEIVQLTSHDLSLLDPEGRARALDAIERDELERRFELSQLPLFRVALVTLAPEEHVSVFTMHHIIGDGWSLGVFIRDFARSYGTPDASPPELAARYVDHAHWQRETMTPAVLDTHAAFWKQELQGAPLAIALPTREDSSPLPHRAKVVPFEISKALVTRLEELALRESTTLFVVLLTAYGALLAHISNEAEIVVGTPLANRALAEMNEVIGFFVNPIPVRLRVPQQTDFLTLVAEAKASFLRALAHQEYPFDKLVEALRPPRTPDRAPVFQVMFGLLNDAAPLESVAGVELSLMAQRVDVAKFELTLGLWQNPEGVAGSLEYDRDRFDPAMAEAWIASFLRLLHVLVDSPSKVPHEVLDSPLERLARAVLSGALVAPLDGVRAASLAHEFGELLGCRVPPEALRGLPQQPGTIAAALRRALPNEPLEDLAEVALEVMGMDESELDRAIEQPV